MAGKRGAQSSEEKALGNIQVSLAHYADEETEAQRWGRSLPRATQQVKSKTRTGSKLLPHLDPSPTPAVPGSPSGIPNECPEALGPEQACVPGRAHLGPHGSR